MRMSVKHFKYTLFDIYNMRQKLQEAQNDGFNFTSDPEDPVIVELMVHPGYLAQEGVGGCTSEGPDEFALDPGRDNERTVLQDKELGNFIRQHAMQMISFHDL